MCNRRQRTSQGGAAQLARMDALPDVEGEIKELKKRLRVLERDAKKSGNYAVVKQVSASVSELEQAYATAKSRQDEEAQALEKRAWCYTVHGARIRQLLELLADVEKAAIEAEFRDRKGAKGDSESEGALLAALDRMRENQAKLLAEMKNSEEMQPPK